MRIGNLFRSVPGIRLTVALLSLLTALGVARAQDEQQGQPWTGEPGITETVAQIMAREPADTGPLEPKTTGKPQRISADRSVLPQSPDSPAVAAWPPLPPGVNPVTERLSGYGQRSPQVLGTSFNGVQLSETGALPPDTMGDVSPTQILVTCNGRIKVFSKTGVLGSLNAGLNTFFNSVRNNSGTSDPYTRFDRTSGRWFIGAINVSTPNRILLAVSSSDTITSTSSFTFFQFQQDLVGTSPNADTNQFADYPSLGVDANAVYMGCRMFNPSFYNCSAWVIRKSSVLGAGPIVVTAFRSLIVGSVGPDAPRGVNNDDPAATVGYFIGADAGALGRLALRRVSNPGGTPTISSSLFVNVPTTAEPVLVPAQGSTVDLEAIDDRLLAAEIHTNRITGSQTLWTAHQIEVNASGVATVGGGRNGVRWYELQNLGVTPALRQSGTLFDSAATSPRYYWMGSVGMSGQGHMALGTSFAATDEFVGAAAAGRLSSDTLGTIQSPTVIITGVAAYTQTGGGTRNRWGDYSHTVVDPSDDMTMWTFQEYANNPNSYAVRVTKLLAPPPATPSSCSPNTVEQGATNVNLIVTGTSAAGSGFFDPVAAFPNHIGASVSGTGVTVNSITWNSATRVTLNVSVAANASVTGRTITVTNPDTQSVTSASNLLTITSSCSTPTITTHPTDVTRCTGTSASFTVAASGTPTPTLQWRKGGVNISGATGVTFVIPSVTAGDMASYDCVATNACGNATSNSAMLTVQIGPGVTTHPSPQTVCVGAPVTLTAAASGTPTPTFQWRKDTTNIPGATGPTFNIPAASAGDAGNYDCVATNACGSVTTNAAALTVNTAPAVTGHPSPVTACSGGSASFSVSGTGTPTPTFQWRKGGMNIDGATSATLTLNTITLGDEGSYDCVLTNACGSAPSNAATLTVNTAPAVTGNPSPVTACSGGSASFSVSGTGTPAPTFQWRKGGMNIDGATSATLTLNTITPGDEGSYDCVLTNACGSAPSNAATLTVQTLPLVTQNPSDQSGCVGSPVVFVAAGSGTPAPTYQWRHNSSPISGATDPTYTIPSLATGDAGNYDCVLTNACGNATTTAATLNVSVGPSITLNPADQTVGEGSPVTFAVAAAGTEPRTYQWRHDATPIPGAGSDTLEIPSVSVADTGVYDCVVSNLCGSVTSTGATLALSSGCAVCAADYNNDGGVDGADVDTFYFDWTSGLPCADVNLDGGIDGADVEYFFSVWEAGGC
ncbi:MAG: immunoglobulin domain-containing protein [Planctomycetes bacterium]|nr:immunoglobulin domain-containing protein [Planctomycetota bacterium]